MQTPSARASSGLRTRAARARASTLLLSAASSSPRVCHLYDVSDVLTPYAEAWGWQKALLEARLDALAAAEDDVEMETQHLDEDNVGAEGANGDAFGHEALGARDALLLVQHPPVVTLGTGSTSDNLKFDPGAPDAPFPVHRTERGGEATYHGPGQLVLYPIMNLREQNPDLHWYMRSLEEVAIVAMDRLGVQGPGRVEGLTGAWANCGDGELGGHDGGDLRGRPGSIGVRGAHKVAAIGVRARRWVTYHGMAFNVDPALRDFTHIVPCGIGDRPVGSVAQMLSGGAGVISSSDGVRGGGEDGGGGAAADPELMGRAKEALLAAFEEVFGMELVYRGGPPPV